MPTSISASTDISMRVTPAEQALLLALRGKGLTFTQGAQPAALALAPHPGLQCAATDRRDWRCKKPSGHGQQHRYAPPEPATTPPPFRPWTKARTFGITSGSRTYIVQIGHPCRVQGERGTWKVVGIEISLDGTKTNVEVTQDRTGHSRTFRSDKIIYRRPPKAVKA